ncbi:TPA: hypothetical protein QDC27_002650 [Burkholderia cepacia ATCC 25416]|uniref:DUF4282 domain-containing protein n=3 Tax=Burkholderia cepacia complex TaxID=87882 RepID=A0AAP4VKA8_9BURK|nr:MULTISPECIES: hypothetical protein [Burkholderia]EJH9638098.1 hypothetical protein [Listeria monocytogenes]HDR9767725.1 hypothetical protein [Burkholderia cepacia ATCC 25416]ELK7725279.1 hypothetical protein [Burkholderia cenocepacia]MBD1415153.1 hypothetical protein [Burkholderia contaminans]MBH9694152.1 hypothetical protein [Burkholderia contaminans]
MTGNLDRESAEPVPTRVEQVVMVIARLVVGVIVMIFVYQWAFEPAIAEILKMPADAVGSRIAAALGLAMVAVFGAVQLFEVIGWLIYGAFECYAALRARGGQQE